MGKCRLNVFLNQVIVETFHVTCHGFYEMRRWKRLDHNLTFADVELTAGTSTVKHWLHQWTKKKRWKRRIEMTNQSKKDIALSGMISFDAFSVNTKPWNIRVYPCIWSDESEQRTNIKVEGKKKKKANRSDILPNRIKVRRVSMTENTNENTLMNWAIRYQTWRSSYLLHSLHCLSTCNWKLYLWATFTCYFHKFCL